MLQRIPNPDNVPGAVTSGYQQQNVNIFTIQTGLDTTEPFDNGNGIITIPLGGVVEVNGVMFKITSNIILPKDEPDTMYWLAVNDNGDGTATIKLSPKAGMWDSAKQGFYNSQNQRILNWNSLGNLNENYIINNQHPLIFSQTVKGEWFIPLRSGWYIIDLMSGLGGGDGWTGETPATPQGTEWTGGLGGGGGIPNRSNRILTVIFHSIHGNKSAGIFNKIFYIKVGGNGFIGDDGVRGGWGSSGGGGGGGGGAGEESMFESIFCPGIEGGRGGNGGNAWNIVAGGGAGGENGGNGGAGGGPSGGNGGAGMGTITYFNSNAQKEIVHIGAGGGGGGGGSATGSALPSGAGFGGAGGDFGINRQNGESGGYCNIFEITG